MEEMEIYRTTSADIPDWIKEINSNKNLIITVTRVKRGPVIEIRFIFREGEVNRKKTSYKNLEQWINV